MLLRSVARLRRQFRLPHGTLPEHEARLQRRMYLVGAGFLLCISPLHATLTKLYNDHAAAWIGFAIIYTSLLGTVLYVLRFRPLRSYVWPLRFLHGGHFLGILSAGLADITVASPSFWWMTVIPLVSLLSGLTGLGVVQGCVVISYALTAYALPEGSSVLNGLEVRTHVAAVLSTTYAIVYLGLATAWRQRLQRALGEARQEVVRMSTAKARFLANMSHEIRTPMYSIIGAIELLRSSHSTDEERSQLLTVQEQSAKALLLVINDILDWSRLDGGEVSIQREALDLRALVFESNEMFASSAFEKNIELTSSSDPDVPRSLSGDGARIRQIVNNLVSNAVKFTARGGVHIHLGLAAEDDSPANVSPELSWVCIAVSDTGIGIHEDRRNAIFAPFTQADASATRRYGGTGLGLAISRELAALMGGHISVRSAVDQGSTFTLFIPLRKGPDVPVFSRPQHLSLTALLVCAKPGLIRHLLSLCNELNVDGQVISHLPDEKEVASFSFVLVDVSLLVRQPTAKPWLAMVMARGVRLALLAPLNAETTVASFGYPVLYKPVGRRALTALMSDDPHAYEHELDARFGRLKFTGSSILVAEDNPINQLIVARMLETSGAGCVIATTGYDALERMKSETFSLVLMNVEMPEMDGLEATKRWRAQETRGRPGGGRLPIIGMTSAPETNRPSICRAAGMDDVLVKPFTLEDLSRVLSEHLELRGRT